MLAKCRLGVGDGRVLRSYSYISATRMGNIYSLLKLVSASLGDIPWSQGRREGRIVISSGL